MIGLRYAERMHGSWHRVAAPAQEYPMEFEGCATIERLSDLVGNGVAKLQGRVVVEGLTRGAPFEGTLGVGAVLRERRLPYAFGFRGDDGRGYRFDGAKEVSLVGLGRAMATLPGYLFDDRGEEVGRAVLHFLPDGRALGWLRAMRPVVLATERPRPR